VLLDIEKEMGRERRIRWGPRNIDLDLIFYEDWAIREERLTVPHPDAHNRTFVMGPIAEIDPDFVHPVLKKRVVEIYRELAK
jgi:2-amino-4-hydroxy-6-hydroxymethyldihydropteridine diphosphokinase